MEKSVRILYAEDDEALSFVTRDNLEIRGYQVDHCCDGLTALEKFRSGNYDLCILDIMLPKADGFTIAEKIRETNQDIPVIFLTAKSAKEDRIHGLKLGGDDYLTKPFSMEELVLKIEVFLRRRKIISARSGHHIRLGKLILDPVNLTLRNGEECMTLTFRETELLKLLAGNLNMVVKREEILNKIWQTDHYFSSRSLDVFISRLRKLIAPDSSIRIETIHNVGYRLKKDQVPEELT